MLGVGMLVPALTVAQEKQPNIILLFADDLGWNDISSPIATLEHGSKNHQTQIGRAHV